MLEKKQSAVHEHRIWLKTGHNHIVYDLLRMINYLNDWRLTTSVN